MPMDHGSATGTGLTPEGGPSPDPSPRKLRAERGEFDRVAEASVCVRGGPHPRPESRTLSRKRERG
jgi:hypothetical protein